MPKMKFLSVAALIALCVGLFAGAALAAVDSWEATGSTFPSALVWDAGAAVSVDTTNDGSTTWDSDYALKSVEGITAGATLLDRWATTSVLVVGTVIPSGTYTFAFDITAPPIATLEYNLPIVPTSVAVVSSFDCTWMLDNGSGLVDTDASQNPISIVRFPDIEAGTAGAWASAQVNACAGRVPLIVGGYPDGTYGPSIAVTRDQMAVFMQRAMELDLETYLLGFTDVNALRTPTFWAEEQIQACVDAGIVGGYSDGTYRPALVVNRDAMAVFVARGMAGGDSNVPSGPSTATFPDVPVSPVEHWAYKYVEFAVDNLVVGGYPDGTYRPGDPVTRDQMAVFVYRAAIQPSGAVVVLAGPAVTTVDTATATYDGWSSPTSAPTATPPDAYIGFDAVKAPSADIDVTFELRNAATPTTVATGNYTSGLLTILAADVDDAKDLTDVSGNPYLYATWNISAGLTQDDYILVTTVNGVELTRKPTLTIN